MTNGYQRSSTPTATASPAPSFSHRRSHTDSTATQPPQPPATHPATPSATSSPRGCTSTGRHRIATATSAPTTSAAGNHPPDSPPPRSHGEPTPHPASSPPPSKPGVPPTTSSGTPRNTAGAAPSDTATTFTARSPPPSPLKPPTWSSTTSTSPELPPYTHPRRPVGQPPTCDRPSAHLTLPLEYYEARSSPPPAATASASPWRRPKAFRAFTPTAATENPGTDAPPPVTCQRCGRCYDPDSSATQLMLRAATRT